MELLSATLARIEKKLDASVRLNNIHAQTLACTVAMVAHIVSDGEMSAVAEDQANIERTCAETDKALKDYNNIK